MTTITRRKLLNLQLDPRPRTVLWAYLLLITMAEYVTAVLSPQVGLILHALALSGLVFHAGTARNPELRKMTLALILAPLIRLLSLSLPLPDFRQLNWYPLVSTPLLVTLWLIMRQNDISRSKLGVLPGNLFLQLMFMCAGLGLGALEYTILRPAPLIYPFTWLAMLNATIILTIFTGFTEELIFRGLLQSLALPVLGRWALLYVALLFAALHIGYLSILDVVFVFGVGMLFAYVVYWGRSILGVTLAHGLTNTVLFLVMPYVAGGDLGISRSVVLWAAWGGTAVALLAAGILMWQAQQAGRLTVGGPFALPGWPQLPSRRPQPAELLSQPVLAPLAPALAVAPAPVARPVRPPAPIVQPALTPVAAAAAPITQPAQAGAMQPAQAFADIYRKLTGDAREPLLHVQLAARTPAALSALLFVPSKRRGAGEIQLYIDGVPSLIPSGQILPPHFRFIEGIVHIGAIHAAEPAQAEVRGGWFRRRAVAAPAPQPDMRLIGRILSKRLTGELATLSEQQPATFRAFWKEFGAHFDRNGQSLDEHRERLAGPMALEAQSV